MFILNSSEKRKILENKYLQNIKILTLRIFASKRNIDNYLGNRKYLFHKYIIY